MPFKISEEKRNSLIEESLNKEDIKEGIQKTCEDKLKYIEYIEANWDEIIKSCSKELEEFDYNEKFYNEDLSNQEKIYNYSKYLLLLISPLFVTLIVSLIYRICSLLQLKFPYDSTVHSLLVAIGYDNTYFVIISVVFILIILEGVYIVYQQRGKLFLTKIIFKDKKTKIETDINNSAINNGILPRLRLEINGVLEALKLQNSIKLPEIATLGLSEVFHPIYEIPTDAKNRLERSINNMPGGSIGISGPRGVGKSTILWSFCRELKEIKGQKIIPLLTSAPINYEPKDFILHILSSLCIKILNDNKRPEEHSSEYIGTFFRSYPPWTSIIFKNVFKIKIISYTISFILLIATIYVATEIQKAAEFDKTTFIVALGISPASILALSIMVFLLGFLLSRFHSGFIRQTDESKQRKNYSPDPVLNEIITNALKLLRRIKYQEILSTTSASTFKLPTLIEGKVDTNVSLNEMQLGLPELVESYKELVALSAKKYIFFIGIDELDKLQSDEQAHNFLNSIKAIFGLENVFYLISVSENAMSSFERRGLPFRDTFDSSFDKVIYINYLSLFEAKQLIDKRVIGIPIPFLCFCYVISGGLPRDLIRVCREMLELLRKDPSKNELHRICNKLIIDDLKSKIRAITFAAKKFRNELDSIEFFREIHKLDSTLEALDSTLETPLRLGICYRNERDNSNSLYNSLLVKDELRSLREELTVYFYYCITLIDFFYDEKENSKKYSLDYLPPYDDLARIRQYLEVNPLVAKDLIIRFREKYADYLNKE